MEAISRILQSVVKCMNESGNCKNFEILKGQIL